MSDSHSKWRYRPTQDRNQLKMQKGGSLKFGESRRKSVTTEDIPMILERWRSTPALEVTKLLEENEVLKESRNSSPVSKYGLKGSIPFTHRSYSTESQSKYNWGSAIGKKGAKTTDDLEFLKRKAEKDKKKRISRNLEMLEDAREKIRAQKLKKAGYRSLPVSARGNSQGFDFSVKVNAQQFQQDVDRKVNSQPNINLRAFNDRNMFQRRDDSESVRPDQKIFERMNAEKSSTGSKRRESRIINEGGRRFRKSSTAENYYKGIDQDIYNILNKRRPPTEDYRRSSEKGEGKCLDPEILFLLYGLPIEPNKSSEEIEENKVDESVNKLFSKPYSAVEARFIRDFMMKYPNYTSEEVISVIKSTPLEKYHSRAAWFQTLRTKLNALGPRFDFDSSGYRSKDKRFNSRFSDGVPHETVALNSMVQNPRLANNLYPAIPRSRPNSLLDGGNDLTLQLHASRNNNSMLSGTEELAVQFSFVDEQEYVSPPDEIATLKSLLSNSLKHRAERGDQLGSRLSGTHSRPNTLLDGNREGFQPTAVSSPVYYSFKPTSPMIEFPTSPKLNTDISNSAAYQTGLPNSEMGSEVFRNGVDRKKNWVDYENQPKNPIFDNELNAGNRSGYQGMGYRGDTGNGSVWKNYNKDEISERGYRNRALV